MQLSSCYPFIHSLIHPNWIRLIASPSQAAYTCDSSRCKHKHLCSYHHVIHSFIHLFIPIGFDSLHPRPKQHTHVTAADVNTSTYAAIIMLSIHSFTYSSQLDSTHCIPVPSSIHM